MGFSKNEGEWEVGFSVRGWEKWVIFDEERGVDLVRRRRMNEWISTTMEENEE